MAYGTFSRLYDGGGSENKLKRNLPPAVFVLILTQMAEFARISLE